MSPSTGPLAGFTILQMGGVGPVPFCGMLLSDLGAQVISVGRLGPPDADELSALTGATLRRGRREIRLDLKNPAGLKVARTLVGRVDGLIEGFRPGVMERIGLGPGDCRDLNPKLVYGRMTGWGQDGPYAQLPGHDINYLALTGILHAMGRQDEPPMPPLNLVGDFGGGGLMLAFGLLAALLEAGRSGRGQVVDASMTDGAALQATMMYEMFGDGTWVPERESNINDGGAPFYRVYETADGKYVAVGAMERRFYQDLITRLGLDGLDLPDQWDRPRWPELRQVFAAVFLRQTRDAWCELLEHQPVCVTPVLSLAEAPHHPHNVARAAYGPSDGRTVPSPAPRFDAMPGLVSTSEDADSTPEILSDLGFDTADLEQLRTSGAIG